MSIIRKTQFSGIVSPLTKKNERPVIIGPLSHKKKQYFIAFYVEKYYNWLFTNFFKNTNNREFFYKNINGLTIFTDNNKIVTNKKKIENIKKLALIHAEIYNNPPFRPQLKQEMKYKHIIMNKLKIYVNNISYLEPESEIEKLYLSSLKNADKQLLLHIDIFDNYETVIQNTVDLFIKISDDPDDKNITTLREKLLNSQKYFEKMSAWCYDRSQTWPNFVQHTDIYQTYQQNNTPFIIKLKNIIGLELILYLLSYFITFGSFDLSFYISLMLNLGKELSSRIIQLENQSRSLLESSQDYDKISKRITDYLSFFDSDFEYMEYRT